MRERRRVSSRARQRPARDRHDTAPAGPGGFVTYELYRNNGRTQRWGAALNNDTVAGNGNGANQALTVYGRVPGQTTPSAGTYNDTITVTVTY